MWIVIACSLLTAVAAVAEEASGRNTPSLPVSINPKVSKFKTGVHRILEGSRIRTKRQLDELNDNLNKVGIGKATHEHLPYLSDYNITFWIDVHHEDRNQVLVGTTQRHLFLFEISDMDDKTAKTAAFTEMTDIAIKGRAFSYGEDQWFAILHYSNNGYYIRLYQRIGRGLEQRQKIDLVGQSDIELVSLKGMQHYLIVSTYSSTVHQSLSYKAFIRLYYWARTQFDEIAFREIYGARSVTCWVLGGSIYIAVAQERNDEENYEIGSPLFLYNSKEENKLVLWDILATFGPSKVQHFYVAGSYYVIFIGRRDAVIYWWSSGQFLEWQTLSGTAFASDLAILSLRDGEVAIVIALKEVAYFYTLDASGYYIIESSLSFTGSNLQSLQFISSGKSYYALALFEEYAQSVWKVELKSVWMPSVLSLDPLRECLLNTQELLRERQTEFDLVKLDVDRIWLRRSNQTIASDVVIQGQVISNVKSLVTNIVIKYHKLPEASMASVIAAVKSVGDSADEAKSEMEHVVYNYTQQEIKGTKRFTDPIYVPSLTVESTSNDMHINNVQISRLNNYALRKAGNQTFPNAAFMSDIWTEKADIGALNEISTNDLLLLHGRQDVTGNLVFSGIRGDSLSTETINTIRVDDIVTAKSSGVISSLKTFSFLQSDVIDVTGETNGVDLESIRSKIATIDNFMDFLGHLTFQSPVSIQGDLFIKEKINGILDIERLASGSVTRDTRQDLAGTYRFKQSQVIDGDMMIAGSINKVSVDHLLTLSSHQNVFSDIHFVEPLTIAGELIVDTVNNVDLSENAVRKLPSDQFISGQKTFTKILTADFIDMTDYTTLDGVDPSFLIQDIIKHSRGIVDQNLTVFRDVTVLGNVTAVDGINGFQVLDLPASVWLKSVEQEIVTPLNASVLHFMNDLDVSTINDLNLEKGIVHSFLKEEISSSKEFQSEVEAISVNTGGNVTINGINLSSIKAQLDHFERETWIRGEKTFQVLEVHGNVMVEKFNGMKILDIMKPDAYQIIEGATFPAEVTTVSGNVQLDSLSLGIFNGINLTDFFTRAVLLRSPNKVINNKDFSYFEASHLSVPIGSTIDGISLHEMFDKVVTLNTEQLITSSKSFESSLNLTKAASVSSMNGLEISDYISKIVLLDEVAVITNKIFLGDVQTTNSFVRGLINGVDINEMAANVFYKSEDNEVVQHFTFKSDVDIGNLLTNSTLDNVEWKDLILLRNDEILGPAWFLSSVKLSTGAFITGLLNGCDLSELAAKSLYMNKSAQVIKEELEIRNIVVIGNIIVKNMINTIEIEELQKFITVSGDQVITSDVKIGNDLTVDQLHLTDLTQSDINLIVTDAVRHSVPQEITGLKTFKDRFSATILEGGDLFVSTLVGINLEELYDTAVRKTGDQEVRGEKKFSTLVLDVATVNRYINGLRLPQDVVLTYTSEHISHPTYIASDVFVPTDLVVSGSIDGVDINSLISNRVTLTGDQNITAELLLLEDVALYDSLTIDGTLNEIVLELVVKTKSMHTIQGYKFFTELHISGPLSALTVNGYDVSRLATDILKYNQDDFINEIQVFDKGMHVQTSLIAEWVNSVPLRYLTEAFASLMGSLGASLQYLRDLSSTLQQQLSIQLSASNGQVSRFMYFILFQEIDMGSTSKISYGYKLDHITKEFSHSLVMWTTQKKCVFKEKCCHLEFSYWLRVKKSGEIVVDVAEESGRYYPIHNPSPMHDKDFIIWTDATEMNPKWCEGESKSMILSSYTQDLSEMILNVEEAPLLSDVKSFKRDRLYIVAAFYYNTKSEEYSRTVVYVYDEFTRQGSEYQTLPSIGVLSMDIIDYKNGFQDEVLLALGTGLDTQPSYSTVYKWNNKNFAFETLQNIPSRAVTSTLWVQKERELLLAMASVEHCPSNRLDWNVLISGGEVNIYLYKKQLKWIQSIPLGGVVSMVSFSVDGDTFLAAASAQHQAIYIYEWKGYAAFVETQRIFVGEVRHISIYWIDDEAYMSVALVSGPSKILKMIRGQHSLLKAKFDHRRQDQNDERPKNPKTIRNCDR